MTQKVFWMVCGWMLSVLPLFSKQNFEEETSIVRGSNRTLKYQPCDMAKYQGNMTMIVQVYQSHQVLTECQVAVFDSSGECRASCFSVPADGGLVYLTVQGEGLGEPLTFRVIYQDGAQEVDMLAAETTTFTNDAMLGSFYEPFVLTIPPSPSSLVESYIAEHCHVSPVAGGVWVESCTPVVLHVCDLRGRVVYLQKVQGNSYFALPKGIYLINGKKYRIR